jgi:hypothetical protein
MYIEKTIIDEKKKEILVAIPLTTTSGKIRVKQRDNIYGYGLPFASRRNKFNQRNYIEWQIAYDIELKNDKINLTTLKDINFTAYNKKKKAFYELSEYLYYIFKFGFISKNNIKDLIYYISNLKESDLIDKHPHCAIKRTHPIKEEINKLPFEMLRVEYPQLIYRFEKYEIITEITIREKQRAVGVQPMLFFCFPIMNLLSDKTLLGREAEVKEVAYFKFDKNNAFIIKEMVKIFGMLSKKHQYDILTILNTILEQ